MKKIFLLMILTGTVFAGGTGTVDDLTGESRIVNVFEDMKYDDDLRLVQMKLGEYIFDNKNQDIVLQTAQRRLVGVTQEEALEFNDIMKLIRKNNSRRISIEKTLMKIDYKPFLIIDFK